MPIQRPRPTCLFPDRHGSRSRAGALLLATMICTAPVALPSPQALEVERSEDAEAIHVRNLAGSRWRAPATLREELSIGVLEGDDVYMFGGVNGLWATEDRIYVVDFQVPAVRAYDQGGKYIRTLGRPGQGPGEYQRPSSLVVQPDGTVVIRDFGSGHVTFYAANGELVRIITPTITGVRRLFALNNGTLLVRRADLPGEGTVPYSTLLKRPEGVSELYDTGEVDAIRYPPDFGYVDRRVVVDRPNGFTQVPGEFLYHPILQWDVTPDGSLVAGLPDRYRFEIHPPKGRPTVVLRYWTPEAIPREQSRYAVRRVEALIRRTVPGYRFDGTPPPATKPAFSRLEVDHDGRIWLLRLGHSERVKECIEDPFDDPDGSFSHSCWRDARILDVFAPGGEYLGEVHRSEQLRFLRTFIHGDLYYAAVEDQDGLVMIKRYRIAGPV